MIKKIILILILCIAVYSCGKKEILNIKILKIMQKYKVSLQVRFNEIYK